MLLKQYKYACCLLLLVTASVQLFAQGKKEKGSHQPAGFFQTNVPAHDVDIILGRPTNNAITVSVMGNDSCEGYVQYGVADNQLTNKTKNLSVF